MGARPGPVKEQIAAFQSGLSTLIHQFIVSAVERHELPADEDPDALTFELNGVILAANSNFVLRQDPGALDMARNVVRRRLGITTAIESRRQRTDPSRGRDRGEQKDPTR
jgi:hypothetical protein